MHVSARDLSSGKEQKIRIEASSGLSEADIKRMLNDAEAHAEEDKKRKEEIDTVNEADAIVFRAEKALKEYGDKIPKAIASGVQSKIDGLKKAIEGKDLGQIRTARAALEAEMQHIGEAMSKAHQQEAPAGAHQQPPHAEPQQGGSTSQGNGIEDAEVEIIDDNEK